MYKTAILGCENSHAISFIEYYAKEEPKNVEIIGVYSDEPDAAKAINEKYGIPIMEGYDSLAGQVDGVIITARHGGNHYKYAHPYIKHGIHRMIYYPIT